MRNCEYIGNPAMFQSRVSGVGSMGPRPIDTTETTFVDRGKIWKTVTLDHPTYGKQTISYQLQVTVKDYVPGSGQVKYTTWGDGKYPGFNPTPEWKTVSEPEFISMFPDWPSIRDNKFGRVNSTGGQDDLMDAMRQRQSETQKRIDDAKSWRQNTPIASFDVTTPSGAKSTAKIFGYNKELGAVWVAEGANARAEDSMLISEAILASKSPEWVAWKSKSGTASALPLLLGAAYLLLS